MVIYFFKDCAWPAASLFTVVKTSFGDISTGPDSAMSAAVGWPSAINFCVSSIFSETFG